MSPRQMACFVWVIAFLCGAAVPASTALVFRATRNHHAAAEPAHDQAIAAAASGHVVGGHGDCGPATLCQPR